ncbi:hypothetical protein HSBAA_55340 [Vreelandella sulfidaeris]|uniref:Uncharacterized protein n=1 Tax=Vreelandella sulfidaeris TaxID=115553 RepID=A0A455UIP4_9GAMM|nr:hypothetical protein HSBAA_55340 [Halomonas sulfidaeris]
MYVDYGGYCASELSSIVDRHGGDCAGCAAYRGSFEAHIGLLMIVGGLFGMALYHAAFGFTSAWRVFITERRGRGLRAQMVMLAIAVMLFSLHSGLALCLVMRCRALLRLLGFRC